MSIPTPIAYTQVGVQKVEDFFNIQQDNNIAIKSAKVIGRGLSDTALVLAALVESAAFAVLTVIALPTKTRLFTTDRSTQAWNNAKLAANAAANAFKGIAGYSSRPEAPAAPVVETPAEAEKPAEDKSVAEPKKATRNIFWENKTKIAVGAGALVLGGLAAYYGYSYALSKAANVSNEVCKNESIFSFNPAPQCPIDQMKDLIARNPYSYRDYSIADPSIDYMNPMDLNTICLISETPQGSILATVAKGVGVFVGGLLGGGFVISSLME